MGEIIGVFDVINILNNCSYLTILHLSIEKSTNSEQTRLLCSMLAVSSIEFKILAQLDQA